MTILTTEFQRTPAARVLPQANVILRVACSVIRNEFTQNGTAVEAIRDWHKHDTLGNVRHFDELKAAGRVTSARGSREAGPDGAIPGIFMLARPPQRP